MRLHLEGIGCHAQTSIKVEHVNLVGVSTIEYMRKKKERNQAMVEIASTLSYAKFDDIKGRKTS